MKKTVALILVFAVLLFAVSCTAPKDLYGTWYVDEGNTRNVIQFSENDEGKDVFVWVVYDLKEDTIESNNTGYYLVSKDKLVFNNGDESSRFELTFSLDGERLCLSSDSASLTLEKYVIE